MFESWFPGGTAAATAPVNRTPDQQAAVDAATNALALYHYSSCGFCARVRAVIEHLNLSIEMRDVLQDPQHRADLSSGGGRTTVPCLRIERPDGSVEWMYESALISAFLAERFGAGDDAPAADAPQS